MPLTNHVIRVVSVGGDLDESQVECNMTTRIEERPVEIEVVLLPILVSPTSSAPRELSWFLPFSYSQFAM